MRYFERTLTIIIVTCIFCIISTLIVPSLGEVYLFMIHLLWKVFSNYFLIGEVYKILLFVIIGSFLFGSIYLTNKQENKVWENVTAIMAIGSIIGLLVFKKLL